MPLASVHVLPLNTSIWFKLWVQRCRWRPLLAVSWCQLALINSAISTPRSYLSWWILPWRGDAPREASDNRSWQKRCRFTVLRDAEHLSRSLERFRIRRWSKRAMYHIQWGGGGGEREHKSCPFFIIEHPHSVDTEKLLCLIWQLQEWEVI